MVKESMNTENIENLPVLNVGMVGHIDHGKTTLLQALSGKFADIHSEELKRGITIKLGYADIVLKKSKKGYGIVDGEPYRYITFIDVPGHEMLMATMLSGAAIIDVAILLVAANEGIKPQTKEHLVALEAKKVKKVIIVQNKIDLVSREEAVKNYYDIKNFIKGTIAENSPIIPVSAQQKVNIDLIYNALAEVEIPERDIKSNPVFVIARSFDINRPGIKVGELHGGILGGTLKSGVLEIGDEIEIKPGIIKIEKNQKVYHTIYAKVSSIYRGNSSVSKAIPGGSLALETSLDMSLTKADNLSECIVGIKGKLPEITSKIKLETNLFKEVFGSEGHKKVEELKIGEMMMISSNTSISVGKIIKANKNVVDLELNIPIVPFKNDNVGLAKNIDGHWRLIGFGTIV